MASTTESKSSLQLLLKNSAVVITLSTALLYFHGHAYYSSYLSYWGLSLDIFPLTTEDALVQGVYLYFVLALKNLKVFGWAIGYVFCVYLLTFFLLFDGPRKLAQKWGLRGKAILEDTDHQQWSNSAFDMVVKIATVVMIVCLFAVLTATAIDNGVAWAKRNHQKVLAGKDEPKPFEKALVTYQDADAKVRVFEGALLKSSVGHVAFYTRGEVLVLPQVRVISIRLPEK